MNSLTQACRLRRSVALAIFATAFGVACGGDDTEVAPLGDAGLDASGGKGGTDSGLPDMSSGGKGGTGGAGGAGATAGTAGKAGSAGSGGAAGSAGKADGGGAAGSAGRGGGDGAAGSGMGGAAGTGGSAGLDSGPDAADSGRDDGGLDALDATDAKEAGPPLTVDLYQHAISEAWCDRIAECCGLDDDHFDRSKCINSQDNGAGPERVSLYLVRYKLLSDAGVPSTVAFDPGQAAQCVELQRNRGCSSVDGNEKRNIYTVCITALQGSVSQGGTCSTSLECRGGLYCSPAADGGPSGTCVPLIPLDGQCTDPNANSDRCTYIGIHASTTLHCRAGEAGSTCQAGLAIGSGCTSDRQCLSGVCSSASSTCVNSQQYPSPQTCTTFSKTPPDAEAGLSSSQSIVSESR
jgi:hypothetical protein